MYIGEFHHQLDEKNRLRVPAKLRKKLGKGYIVTKGTNNCLFVFPREEFQSGLIDKFKNETLLNEDAKKPVRLVLSSAFEVEEDKQGRFVLPKSLKKYAFINKDLVFLGMGNYLEIWSKEKWNEYTSSRDFTPNVFKRI